MITKSKSSTLNDHEIKHISKQLNSENKLLYKTLRENGMTSANRRDSSFSKLVDPKNGQMLSPKGYLANNQSKILWEAT